jgi:hypothetical protein
MSVRNNFPGQRVTIRVDEKLVLERTLEASEQFVELRAPLILTSVPLHIEISYSRWEKTGELARAVLVRSLRIRPLK